LGITAAPADVVLYSNLPLPKAFIQMFFEPGIKQNYLVIRIARG